MTLTRRLFGATSGLMVMLLPVVLRAEVSRAEISRRQDVLSGKAFGETGAYEKLVGKVYYAVAPERASAHLIL